MPIQRVTLTKKQLTIEDAASLRGLLKEITKDGELSLGEISALECWLAERKTKCDIPAIRYLLETVNDVVLDGKVFPDDRLEIMRAIERVLPLPDRKEAKAARLQAQATTQSEEDEEPGADSETDDDELATEPQIAYIRALGGEIPTNLGKWQASELITKLKNRPSAVSQRQMMVLRFWDKVELAQLGRAGVSDWMDDWYTKDPRHLEAWELYKREAGDDGRQADPNRVRIGAGHQFLTRLAGPRGGNPFAAIESVGEPKELTFRGLVIILAIAAILAVAIYFLRKPDLP